MPLSENTVTAGATGRPAEAEDLLAVIRQVLPGA